MNYNFKQIKTIPTAVDLINIVLSKTQRKTPTVVHPGYAIQRIRSFYMRKVKFCAEAIHEKFHELLEGFPKLDDIHPFYADLINVIYDRDHYKIALGHIHTAMNLVDNIAKDYVRMLKHGDSLYRCKMLKRASLGRMVKVIKRLGPSLSFLEEVRKHLARMASIDPYTRTLLITGFPNVGKSSFINQITNANVEVQPYPFTTQSLFVGHTDYDYVRWQIIDSPGILDKPLDQRNTIEMQSITALAHLKACVLFFIDISEQCGYSLEAQISLYNNIKALFVKKPVVIVFTKIDLKRFDELDSEHQDQLRALIAENGVGSAEMSNASGEGILNVKETACKLLLEYRLGDKVENVPSNILKREEEYLRGVYVALPKSQREDRPPNIPDTVQRGESVKRDRPTLKEIQESMGGAGVFNFPLQEHYMLEDPNWKFDAIPEIMDGMNIADFVDKDIMKRIEELEREEEMLLLGRPMDEMDEEEDPDLLEAKSQITNKKALLKIQHKLKSKKSAFPRNLPLEEFKEALDEAGKETNAVQERFKNTYKPKPLTELYKETIEEEEGDQGEVVDEGEEEGREHRRTEKKMEKRLRSISRSRSVGVKRELSEKEQNMERLKNKVQEKMKKEAKKGEADRTILNLMPNSVLYWHKKEQNPPSRKKKRFSKPSTQ
jgi:nucleolar GTP-binding protein